MESRCEAGLVCEAPPAFAWVDQARRYLAALARRRCRRRSRQGQPSSLRTSPSRAQFSEFAYADSWSSPQMDCWSPVREYPAPCASRYRTRHHRFFPPSRETALWGKVIVATPLSDTLQCYRHRCKVTHNDCNVLWLLAEGLYS